MEYVKSVLSLEKTKHEKLMKIADEKGVTIQELMRAVIIPTWLRHQPRNVVVDPFDRKKE